MRRRKVIGVGIVHIVGRVSARLRPVHGNVGCRLYRLVVGHQWNFLILYHLLLWFYLRNWFQSHICTLFLLCLTLFYLTPLFFTPLNNNCIRMILKGFSHIFYLNYFKSKPEEMWSRADSFSMQYVPEFSNKEIKGVDG